MRLREADRFSEEVCRLATTEVKRFWMAPRSARVLFTDSRALSTIDSACCAPSTVVTFRSLTKLLPAPVSVPPAVLVWVSPRLASVAGVAAALAGPAKASAKVWPSLTDARLIAPAFNEASTPVSPSLPLIAAAVAALMDSPALTEMSPMSIVVAAAAPGAVTEICSCENTVSAVALSAAASAVPV